MLCLMVLLALILSAVFAPYLGLADPYKGSMIKRLAPIGTPGYPLGSDEQGRDMLARLVYPVANPRFPYVFSKGYYPRINGNHLSGRVTRLFVTPLIRALKKVVGPLDYLEFMDSFRDPLSGEFSLSRSFVKILRV
jgi:hypothetical protein